MFLLLHILILTVSPGLTASGCMDNGSTQVVAPVSTFAETHRSSSVPINLASPARVSPIGKPLSFREPDHALDEMKFANQGVPSFHPHSLPEYHDSLANGIPFNSSCTIIDMASSSSPMMAEGLDNRHIRGARSNGHLMQPNAGGKLSWLWYPILIKIVFQHLCCTSLWIYRNFIIQYVNIFCKAHNLLC